MCLFQVTANYNMQADKQTKTHLACISSVDDLDPFLSRQAIHVYLVGVPAAVSFLLGPPILEVELHLHLIYPLDKRLNILM